MRMGTVIGRVTLSVRSKICPRKTRKDAKKRSRMDGNPLPAVHSDFSRPFALFAGKKMEGNS